MARTTLFAVAMMSLLLIPSAALAGPTSTKDATFHFGIPEGALPPGDWRLSFISVGDFESGGWNFSQHRGLLIDEYADHKARCGLDGTFREIIYEMSPEERAHKGCVVNGTYQEVYCFKVATDIPACAPLLPDKIDDMYRLEYKSYYDSALWDIGRAEFYHHHALASCRVAGGACVFTVDIGEAPYTPFIIVAERLNSTDEIYFSEPMDIPGVEVFDNESLFSCGAEAYCDVHANVTLYLREFGVSSPNSLRIAFDDGWAIADAFPGDDAPAMPRSFLSRVSGFFSPLWRAMFS